MPAIPSDPDAQQRRIDDITRRLDSVENTAYATINDLANGVEQQVQTVENVTKPIVADVNKYLNEALRNADDLAAHEAASIYNAADQHLSNAYVDATNNGAVYPTIEKVRQGNATGDYFGSMGFQGEVATNTPTDTPIRFPTEQTFDGPIAIPPQPKTPRPPNQTVEPPPITVINQPVGQLPDEPPAPPPLVPPLQPPTTPPGVGPAGNKSIPLVLWWGNCQTANEPFYDPRLTNGTNFDPFIAHAPPGCDNTWNKIDGTNYVGNPVGPNDYVFQVYDDAGRTSLRVYTPFVGYKPYATYLKNSGKYTLMFSAGDVCNKAPVCATTPPPETPPPLPPTTPPPETPPPLPPTTPPNTNSCGTVGPSPNVKYPGGECMNFAKMIENLASAVWAPANFLAFTGLPQQGGISIISSLANMLMSGPNGILTATIQRFTCWLEGVIKNVTKDLDCDASKLLPAAVFNGVVQFIQKWTGALPTPVVANLEQAINYTCQSFFPGQGAANALYNAGLIDEEVWTCYTKVAGNHVAPQKQIREISRTRLDPMQWTALYMRELIGKDTWQQKLHEAGVLYDNEIQAYRDIQIAQPQLDDVIRMMVRDVADKDLVERFCMDDDFPDKWVGPLKKLGEHLGVTDDLAKLYWRAHWHLPSPTQLYEMLHRLRPGRVAEEIQVTEDDVRTALKQDDLLPFWVDREMAISYSPLRLVDIRRAYMLEAIDDEELYNLTRDRGLNDADAQITVKLYQKMKEEADLKKIGAPKPAKYATMFVNRIISKEEMNEVFGELNVPEKTQQAMLHFAELDQEYKDRQETIAAIKKMFMTGLIGYDEATKRLSDDSVPGETVNKLLERWSHNITRKPKEIPAAQLCKMRSLSVITPQQQLAGLIRLNYSQDQAKQIVQLCEFELQEKQAKAMERAAAKAKADAEKAAKAQEKAAKEAAKAQQQQQPAHTNA